MAKFITVKQAAEIAGVTPQSIRNLCKQGALSYKEEPQRFMVKLEEVKKLDYQIKEYDAIEGKIDELLADERKRHAEVVKTDKHNRFVLNELGLAPKRILMIRDLLVSILKSHYQNRITPREFQIVVDILGGRNVPDMKDTYNISVPHVTIIWRRALRRLVLEKGMLQAKDDIIADLEKKILDLEDTILELKGLKEKESAEEEKHKRMVLLLSCKLIDMDLSVRSLNCLKIAEIYTFYDLVTYKREDLLKFRNFGKKSIAELDELLERNRISFGMDVSEYELEVKESIK